MYYIISKLGSDVTRIETIEDKVLALLCYYANTNDHEKLIYIADTPPPQDINERMDGSSFDTIQFPEEVLRGRYGEALDKIFWDLYEELGAGECQIDGAGEDADQFELVAQFFYNCLERDETEFEKLKRLNFHFNYDTMEYEHEF